MAELDRGLWLACAVPTARLPAVGSQVYYFPHGHAEQCPLPLSEPLPEPHVFPCTVRALQLLADPETDEPYAIFTLAPGPHRQPAPPHAPPLGSAYRSYSKNLTQSDANNGGGFSVPRSCAISLFPALNLNDDPPVQNLHMRDLLGNDWNFRHIYRGTPRRHLLTTGWSKFVNEKVLIAGDAVVFIQHQPSGCLIIGLRRVLRTPALFLNTTSVDPPLNSRARVPTQEIMDAARNAAKGRIFRVTYYPRQGAGAFVVPRKEVEDALCSTWEPQMQVRMQSMDTEWLNGVVKTVRSSVWRMLVVEWDLNDSPTTTETWSVNPWQIQVVGYPPVLGRYRFGEPSSAPAVPIFTSMPAARYSELADVPSSSGVTSELNLFHKGPVPLISNGDSSEVVNPGTESPPDNSVSKLTSEVRDDIKSIQLFGTTITLPVQCSTSGTAGEVDQVPSDVPVIDGSPLDRSVCKQFL